MNTNKDEREETPGEEESGDGQRYRVGDQIEVSVEGYDKPFVFVVTPLAFKKLMKADKKHLYAASNNFLKDSSLDWDNRLKHLLDESSPNYDITLDTVLGNHVLEAVGLMREATVKKRSPAPPN